jgi:hypothetical protein
MKKGKANPFIQVVGDSVYELEGGELKRKDSKDKSKEFVEEKLRKQREFQEQLNKRNNSLKHIVDMYRTNRFMNLF